MDYAGQVSYKETSARTFELCRFRLGGDLPFDGKLTSGQNEWTAPPDGVFVRLGGGLRWDPRPTTPADSLTVLHESKRQMSHRFTV